MTKSHSTPDPSRDQLPIVKRLAFSAIVALLPLFILVGIELGVRLVMKPIPSLELLVVTPEQKTEVAKGKESPIFEGDPLLLWRLRPGLDRAYWDYTSVSTNAQGFRAESSDRSISAKRSDMIRIVCLGDSVTFGFRTPLTYPSDPSIFDPAWVPYPMLLERELRRANPGKKIEVITMAVPGYSSTQGRLWFEREIDRLRPDFVTVSFGWNDASRTQLPDREVLTLDSRIYLNRWLIVHSQVYAHWSSWMLEREREKVRLSGVPPPAPHYESRTSTAEYLDNMSTIVRLAAERGIPHLILAAPFRDNVENGEDAQRMLQNRLALGQLMNGNGTPFLEIAALTESNYPSNSEYFGERIHPSHTGHRLIASEILKIIASRNLFPDLSIEPMRP